MVLRSRQHVIRLETGTVSNLTGEFNLNPGSRLTHASVRSASGTGPVRCLLTLAQPRSGTGRTFMEIVSGWVRGSSPGPVDAGELAWSRNLEIDTDQQLIFSIRNDTADTVAMACAFMVVE